MFKHHTNINSLKKFGIAGFTFFLAKGLLWIVIPLVIYHFDIA